MAMKVYFNNTLIYSLKNGENVILSIPAIPGYLRAELVGNSMNFHPIKGETYIDPSACRQGGIDCQLTIEPDWLGILLGGVFRGVGKLKMDVQYI